MKNLKNHFFKEINNLVIRKKNDESRYSIYTLDKRLLVCNLDLEEAINYCKNNKNYLSEKSRKKVYLKNIKAKRLNEYEILLVAHIDNQEDISMVSRYPNVESAKRDFQYRVNSGLI